MTVLWYVDTNKVWNQLKNCNFCKFSFFVANHWCLYQYLNASLIPQTIVVPARSLHVWKASGMWESFHGQSLTVDEEWEENRRGGGWVLPWTCHCAMRPPLKGIAMWQYSSMLQSMCSDTFMKWHWDVKISQIYACEMYRNSRVKISETKLQILGTLINILIIINIVMLLIIIIIIHSDMRQC